MSEQPSAGRELDVLVARALDLPEGAYSTELMASWQVAQWLSERGYQIDVDTWAGGGSTVRITSPVDDQRAFHGATPAEALCRAAVALAADE